MANTLWRRCATTCNVNYPENLLTFFRLGRIPASQRHCVHGYAVDPNPDTNNNCQLIPVTVLNAMLQDYFDNFIVASATRCSICNTHLVRWFMFLSAPPLLALDISQSSSAMLDTELRLTVGGGQFVYKIQGALYHRNNHFNARFFTASGLVWYHDGMTTGHVMQYKGRLCEITGLSYCHGKAAVSIIYMQWRIMSPTSSSRTQTCRVCVGL